MIFRARVDPKVTFFKKVTFEKMNIVCYETSVPVEKKLSFNPMEANMKVKLLQVLSVMILSIPLFAQSADITGAWKAEFDTQIGIQKYVFEFKQTDAGLSGTASSDIGGEKQVTPLTEIKLDSNRVSFVEILSFQGEELRISYQGTVSGNEMKLTRNVGEFVTEEVVAKREEPTGSVK